MYNDENVVVLLPPGDIDAWNESQAGFEIAGAAARQRFREFFRNFRLGNIYLYREALIRHWNRNEYFVEVDLAHVDQYDQVLFNAIQTQPESILKFFETGAKDALKLFLTEQSANLVNNNTIPDFQIILKSSQLTQSLRNLTAEHVNKLIKVPGIVISCSKIRAKATSIVVKCNICRHTKVRKIQKICCFLLL